MLIPVYIWVNLWIFNRCTHTGALSDTFSSVNSIIPNLENPDPGNKYFTTPCGASASQGVFFIREKKISRDI